MDMMKMLGKMKDVQAKIQEAQENLVNVKSSAESGGGMVKATVNGKKQVVELDIDDDLFKPEDKDMLKDLVIAAINKAMEDVEVKSKEELKKSTEGFLPNIPGMDFGNL
ncbi:YbaB/EbfC family nucleoid-associated protein [Flexithrix dorotheae]|uniref:YbaB/EbfC family nucleoid-associated protein n=1 Tax=Flexithrix dorotheae TaxID=70993 RepID=UPI000382B332